MRFKKTIEYSLDQIPQVVAKLAEVLKQCQVMTFTGPLGAGKTTLVQSLLRAQGVADMITSPTFTYVNAYKNQRGETFYHFDLYRIDSLDNFHAQGFEEYLFSSSPLASSGCGASDSRGPKITRSWALIEWPEVIASLLTHDVCNVKLEYGDEPEKRIITIECVDGKNDHEQLK